MKISKIKKNFKKRFISKKKQIGKGFTQKNTVPILPFPEKLLDEIMKEVVCTCDLKLSANYDKRSFQFYNPNRELMFDKNMLISRLIIKDDDVFTDKELSEIQRCIYLAVAKYQESDDDSSVDTNKADYEKNFNVMDTVRINLELCNYKNFKKIQKNSHNQVATIIDIYKKGNKEMCILRFHNSGIGHENSRHGPNTVELPMECLEEYNLSSSIQLVVGDHAFINFNLNYCSNMLNPNFNNSLGKIVYIYVENNIEMCIFKFLDSKLGAEHPKFGPNVAEIPINCLEWTIVPNHDEDIDEDNIDEEDDDLDEEDDDLDEQDDVCRKMLSTNLQIGDRVISCGPGIYDSSVPIGSKGSIVSIRERYQNSSEHRQYKVKFDNYPLGGDMSNMYYDDRLRRI
jgi:hypothetical protein